MDTLYHVTSAACKYRTVIAESFWWPAFLEAVYVILVAGVDDLHPESGHHKEVEELEAETTNHDADAQLDLGGDGIAQNQRGQERRTYASTPRTTLLRSRLPISSLELRCL